VIANSKLSAGNRFSPSAHYTRRRVAVSSRGTNQRSPATHHPALWLNCLILLADVVYLVLGTVAYTQSIGANDFFITLNVS